MAEEHPDQTVQHEKGTNEEMLSRNERLQADNEGQGDKGEASSSSQHERSRPHEDEAGHTRPPCSPQIHPSPETFRCWHESSQSSEIEDFIYEPGQPSALQSQLFMPEDADCGSWFSSSSPKCPASFGDHGTTATTGAFGQLVQFSDYLGAGNSGMFSAGHCHTTEPFWFTRRVRQLHSFALESFEHAQRKGDSNRFGLNLLNLELSDDAPPWLKWFQYQWPCYEYKIGCFKGMKDVGLTIQFIARNRTVFQQCILENWGDTDVDLDLAFCKGLIIRDLDDETGDYDFNKTTPDHQNAGPGPGGFSWVHVNRFREGSPDARAASQHPIDEQKSNTSHGNRSKKDQPNHGIALVASMAVDGEMIKFSPGQSPHIWKQTLKAKPSTPGSRSHKLEIVTAYKLMLLEDPLSDWKIFVVPLKDMNPSRFLRETMAVSSIRTSITRISGKDDPVYNYDNGSSETPKDEKNKGEAAKVNFSQDGVSTVDSEPQTELPPAADHEPTQEKNSPTMDQIEFSARRNLSHILGVCAIPVAARVSGENDGGLIWERLRDVQPIALSCGDLSGHLVRTKSSFFAFKFLAEVANRLSRLPQPDRDDTHVQALLSRIRDVCLGHLKWLYVAEKTNRNKASFGPFYWVNGKAIPISSSDEDLALYNSQHTAFHILKAVGFANAFNDADDDELALIGEMIRQWGRGWVRWLERFDRRESFTWYHREDEGFKIFRLDDHVWIWMALKAMEDKRFGAWAILHDRAQRNDRSSSTGSEEPHAYEMSGRSRKFASRTVQREILRKFTMKHEILRKDMVALTRSPMETRFLFHARDTALLYGQDMGFFTEDESSQEVWKNTISAQRLHEDNQEARWDNALRYALSLMLGIRGYQISNREPGSMVRTATEVLLRSSSGNGLFPGKLDIMTKGPLENVFHVVNDAASCYDAGFEIPYIFLIHAEAIGVIVDNITEPALETASGKLNLRHNSTGENLNSTEGMPSHNTKSPQEQVDRNEEDRELRMLLAKLSDVLSSLPCIPSSTSASDMTVSRELVGNARLALKKTIPLSNIIDSHSIVEIEDEWLFNYPDFFGFDDDKSTSIDKTLDSLKDFEVGWLTRIDVAKMRRKYSSHNNLESGSEDQSNTSSHDSWSTATESSISLGGPGDSGLTVMDMPSRKRLQVKRFSIDSGVQIGSLGSIWERISRPRTVAKAKKRIIFWEPRGTDPGLEAALLCYAASRGDERANMLEFFERHFQQEKFMFDHCNLASNTWETELHLSFLILEDSAGPLSDDTARNLEGFPGVRGKQIFRGAVGLRFHGDAFDRYWTLHVFHNLSLAAGALLGANMDAFGRILQTDESALFQRKVYEGHFVSNMLGRVTSSTERILAEVKSEMGIKSGAFSWSVPSMDTYSSWSKLWEGFAPLLQALTDDLISTQGLIGQWETREDGRGQEKPRWTHNDEKKYRADITRCQRVLQWRKKRIQDLLDDVESLREACTARLANAREELSFRSNQNIASFTYVTIVFLPLGFAANVFSMNGYPAAGWVASMVVIAVVTLAITVIALANAKLLLAVAEQLFKDAMRLTRDVFQSSLIGQQKRQRDERAQDPSVPSKPSYGDPKGGDPLQSHAIRHVLFWIAYLLIELPARRVALACRALPASLMQSLGLLRPDATPPASVSSSSGSSGSSASVGSTGGSSEPPAAAAGRKIIRIAGGILILPLLVISWTIQLFFYNVLDILTFLGRLTKRILYALVAPSDTNGPATDTKMVTWLIEPPPSLRPVRKYMSRDEKSEKPAPQVDPPVAVDRSDTSSLEEA